MNGTTGSARRSDATTAVGMRLRLCSLSAIVPSSSAAPRSSCSGSLAFVARRVCLVVACRVGLRRRLYWLLLGGTNINAHVYA
eukprot:3036041-Pleurochrysis_carterae.AAC.1